MVPARDHFLIGVELIEGADDAAVAGWIAERLRRALRRADHAAVAFPGGSTPLPIFELLAAMDLPWPRIVIWPGDDRIVGEDHPASNVGKIRACFAPRGAQVVPLTENARPPHFGIVWLGMGNDGHIASLFPGSDPRPDDPHKVVRITPDPLPPEAPFDRLSLTMPALVDCDALMFVIRGADKRRLFDAAMRGEHDLPVARLLRAARGPVTCFC